MHTSGLPPNRLRELRIERGLTYMDVAVAVRTWPSTVVRWEKTLIPQNRLMGLAELLEVSVPYLAGWTDTDEGPRLPASASEVAA